MPYIQVAKSSIAPPVKLYYEDTQSGVPVVFIHGWPLSHDMWEYQFNELPAQGIRCIAYDRRGFGKSDRPWSGYDYDTLATDLHTLLDELKLDKVVLVGFSMGGGEVARYIGKFGTGRISKLVLISAVTPFMLKTEDNPEGIPLETFNGFEEKLRNDRPAFLGDFGKLFYGVHLLNKPASSEFLAWSQGLAMMGSPRATLECLHSFSSTDFRKDLLKCNIPAFVIHGDADKIVPFATSGQKTAAMIPDAQLKIYEGSPHGLWYTDRDMLNRDLVDFIINNTVSVSNELPDNSFTDLNGPFPGRPYPII
jgi:non-heme chloroperoxidase